MARTVKLAFVMLLLRCAPALAETPNPHLEAARALYKQLQYADMVHKLEMALTVPGNTKEQLCEIYSLMGTIHAILENRPAARKAFASLLAIDPDYALDEGLSPKILDLFSSVKQEFVPPVKVSFRGHARVTSAPGAAPRLETEVDDPAKALVGLDLWYRLEEQGPFKHLQMAQTGDSRYGCELPMAPGSPGRARLEYYIQARGTSNRILAALGAQDHPSVIELLPAPSPVEQPPLEKELPPTAAALREDQAVAADEAPVVLPDPWYQQWWFWTAVGVLAAGAVGLGVGLGLSGGGEVPAGSLGTLPLK
ncbi:MAG: hypothetical protein JXR96_12560 [Deltaproteobacteria bacterium]|nr:hypothetical protein [Deltaproteobacteria bacterium]